MTSPHVLLAAGVAALLATIAPAARPTPAQELDRALAGRTAGRDVDCLPSVRNDSGSRVIDGTAIVYGGGPALYVNRLGGTCSQLGYDTIVVTRSYSRLCRGDIVQLVSRTIRAPVGSCVLGSFTPYTRPRRSSP